MHSTTPCNNNNAKDQPQGSKPRVWRSNVAIQADRQHVLETLTAIDACHAWTPVEFEVDAPRITRLLAGTRVAVSGGLAGRRLRFCVEVFAAEADRLLLHATGPVDLTADYELHDVADGSHVDAAISVRHGSGRLAPAFAAVTSGLLAGGALNRALRRIAEEAERRQRCDELALGRAA